MTLRHTLLSISLIISLAGGCMTENPAMFLTLQSSKMSAESPEPGSFYVQGRVKDGHFVPESGVLGEGQFAAEGTRGWLELTTGQFHPDHAMRTPESPYIKGVLTKNGFVPSSREVK